MSEQPDLSHSTFKPGRPHILFGPHGLRAGWGCLLFLLLLAALLVGVNLGAHFLLHLPTRPPAGPVAPVFLLTGELISAGAVFLVTLLLARLEHHPFGSYGMGDPAALPRFGGGLLSGFAAISALVALLWRLHLLTLSGPVLASGSALRYGLLWGFGFIAVALAEELMLRGYLLFTLTRGLGFWWSALLLSAAFGAIHGNNTGETPVGLFSAAAVGLMFCLSIWYTGSLWWAIGFHAAWDWGQSFFWGTSDSGLVVRGHLLNEQPMGPRLLSGGATGPEGSLYIFLILLLASLGIFLYWRGKGPAVIVRRPPEI